MTDQLRQIGERIAALREIEEIDVKTMAARLEMSEEDYILYEEGKKDFSVSFLNNVAVILGVDMVDIMVGDSPKLSIACVVRKGEGFEIDRRAAYNYKHLAFTFRKKIAEPFYVTVEPNDIEKPTQHAHEGQEFDYVLEGSMTFFIGDIVYELNEGDSVYFNSDLPHAMKATNGKPCKFLAIVMKGDI